MSRQRGYTLVELMIVVTVIGILASVGYPAYTRHVEQTRRADALVMLLQVANQQERMLTKTGRYSLDAAALNRQGLQSEHGYYRLQVLTDGSDTTPPVVASVGAATVALSCAGARCFQLAAVATGVQVSDTQCAILTLDHLGRQRSYDASGNRNSAGTCWH